MTPRCLYCSTSYPPATPSREHVLPDVFGGDLKLPSGVVCESCNGFLNKALDVPLRDTYRFYLNMFSIGSSRRGSSSAEWVEVETEQGGFMPARLPREGRLFVNPVTPLPPIEDGLRPFQFANASSLELHRSAMAAKGMVPTGEPETVTATNRIRHASGPEEVVPDSRWLHRATAKAALNLLAFRAPHLAASAALGPVRRFVRYDEGECSGSRPPAGEVNTADLRPVHMIGVGSDDGVTFRGELRLFGELVHVVEFCGAWDGEPGGFLEDFDAVARTSEGFAWDEPNDGPSGS